MLLKNYLRNYFGSMDGGGSSDMEEQAEYSRSCMRSTDLRPIFIRCVAANTLNLNIPCFAAVIKRLQNSKHVISTHTEKKKTLFLFSFD